MKTDRWKWQKNGLKRQTLKMQRLHSPPPKKNMLQSNLNIKTREEVSSLFTKGNGTWTEISLSSSVSAPVMFDAVQHVSV